MEEIKTYKYCITPRCTNTTFKTPDKLFFCLPMNEKKRLLWLSAVRRHPTDLSNKSHLYVCEDHFNLEEDMENYIKFRLVGGQLKLKPNVVPHKFACQLDGNEDKSSESGGENESMECVNLDSNIVIKEGTGEYGIYQCIEQEEDYPPCGETTEEKDPLSISCELSNNTVYVNKDNELEDENIIQKEIVYIDHLKKETAELEELAVEQEFEMKKENMTGFFQEATLSISCKQRKAAVKNKIKQPPIKKGRKNSKKDVQKINCSNIGPKVQRRKKNITCDICRREFTHIHLVKNHINFIHNKIKTHTCTECHNMFSNAGNLMSHIKRVHKKIRNFSCKECGEMFSDQSTMRKHVDAIHEGIRKFLCDVCQKPFSQLSNLRIHISIHDINEDLVCRICNIAFSKSSSFKDHIRSFHEGIKDFSCKFCGRRFYRVTELEEHVNTIHKEIKNYVCEFCGKKFSQVPHLKIHVNTVHKKSRNFACNFCNKSFFLKENLQKHVKHIHIGIKYDCGKCGKKYSTLSSLRTHISRIHRKSTV